MDPKLLFAILGLLIVLFLCGTGLGVMQGLDSDGSIATPGWGEDVREMLEQPLKPEDVKTAFPSDCREQLRQGTFVLPPGDTCTLIIKESRANVRTLSLELTEGPSATVVMNPGGEDRLTARQTLEDTEGESSKEVSIFKEGGTLEIQCGPAAACRLQVSE